MPRKTVIMRDGPSIRYQHQYDPEVDADPHPPSLACPTKAPLDQEHAHLTASPPVLDISWIVDIMYSRSAFPTEIMNPAHVLLRSISLPCYSGIITAFSSTACDTDEDFAGCSSVLLQGTRGSLPVDRGSRARRNSKHAWSALNPVLKAVVERMIFPYINLAYTNSLYTSHSAGDVRTCPVKPC